MTVRVAIADDQALVRGGFRMILDAKEDIAVVGEADDGAQAVSLAERTAPDVVLMDVRMPVMDGIEATRRIVAAGGPRGSSSSRRTTSTSTSSPPCGPGPADSCSRTRAPATSSRRSGSSRAATRSWPRA